MCGDRGGVEVPAVVEIRFRSEGAVLAGRLFLPPAAAPGPVVVMAHGFSATAHGMVADRYAQAFADHGVAAFLYDHRGVGRSRGEPRGEINPWIQARGYRDALDAVSACDRVDPQRVALWGDSYSAAQVLAVACVDERVRAVVAQTPACGRHPAPPDPDGALYRGMRARLLGGSVRAEPERWRGPMPVVSADQLSAPSALKPLTALRWFLEYGARFGTGWENQVVLTAPEEPMWLPVLWAQHVLVPTCFLLARDDEMPGSTTAVARQAFAALGGPKEVHELEGGHFGLLYHHEPVFERSVAIQTRFLSSWLHDSERPGDRY
ncbi:hypothetical protein CIK52_15930 [Kocuria rosea]|nr:alpha/beta fold hydrolase [Kocuria salina]PWF80259.1 hypothetical protein DEJ38_14515 [Kocuria rosea]NVC23886.1 alpha/beta fold hydrolase [Kocuria salina]PWF82578.1 hypothetical protein CIK52_15930 [Kocuria rosea]PWF84682.1 hypothetical protein DEJ37_13025 [Kocuria rosea]QCY33165.1 alpha/beta fold hydrolase [Kocuria rosea]